MDNLENQPGVPAQEPQAPAPKPSMHSITSSRKGKMWWISAIVIIVLIIIIIALFSINNKNLTPTGSKTSQVDTQLTEFQQNIHQIQNQLNTLEQNMVILKKSDADQSEAIQLAVSTNQRLQTELTGKQNGWLIDEALYLTRLATYSLNFQNNASTSILLLQNADDALFRTGSASVMNARHVLAQDIFKLQAISTVDVSGVYLQLQVLSEQLNKLPVVDEMMIKKPEKQTDDTHTNTHWKDSFTNNLKHLSSIVVIQHRDKPIYPLLTQEEYNTLTIYLTLLSSHAQWALLHRSDTIYQNSLKQMSTVISTYYANNNDITKKTLEKIAALSKINVAPPYPNINDVVDALNQLAANSDNKTKLGEKTL